MEISEPRYFSGLDKNIYAKVNKTAKNVRTYAGVQRLETREESAAGPRD